MYFTTQTAMADSSILWLPQLLYGNEGIEGYVDAYQRHRRLSQNKPHYADVLPADQAWIDACCDEIHYRRFGELVPSGD